MKIENYFDNAATTPLDPHVNLVLNQSLSLDFGNPHSIHSCGRIARSKLEASREFIASSLGAEDPQELIFTSGATESNNWIAASFVNAAYSPFEHSSMRESAITSGWRKLKNIGWQVEPEELAEVAAVMLVNNETGAILCPQQLRGNRTRIHSDITQAFGKVTFEIANFDFASLSGHKIYGPKGVGLLYAKGGQFPKPLLKGGGQEFELRAGTVNVPGILALAESVRIAVDVFEEEKARAELLRQIVLEELRSVSGWSSLDHVNQSPYILSLSFEGTLGEAIVVELDNQGFAVSSGAACDAGSTEPSPALVALGVSLDTIRATVRLSFGKFNTQASTEQLAKSLVKTVDSLRNLAK